MDFSRFLGRIRLDPGESVRIILPDGKQIIVHADGTITKPNGKVTK